MGRVSARISEDLDERLGAYLEEENLDESAAVRKLLIEGLERWERKRAVVLLQEGCISFTKAAKMARMDVWAFAAFLGEEGIAWVDEEGVLKDLEEA